MGPPPSHHEIARVPLLHVNRLQESLDSPIDRRSDYYRRLAYESADGGPGARTRSSSPARPARQALLTPPNVLTFARLAMVPAFVALWFDGGRCGWRPPAAAAVFIAAAVTDWADGYLARRLQITSAFGAFLDPVADKIMVTTALVLMAAAPPAPLTTLDLAIPVALIICREITMSSLREWAAASGGGAHKAVKVNSLGKWKTALQMVAMSAMLVLRRAEAWLPFPPRTAPGRAALARALATGMWASLALLWAGAFLAVLSLYYYMANVWHFFLYPDGPPPPQAHQRAQAAPRTRAPPAPAAALANGNGYGAAAAAAAAADAAAAAELRPRTRRGAAGR